MQRKKNNVLKLVKTALIIIVGQFLGAIAFSIVFLPNQLVAGGFGGLATVLNQLFGWNIQMVLIALCTPVILWSFFKYDKKQVGFAGICFALFTFYIGIVDKIFEPFYTDPIIAVVTGGILFGISGGMIISQGSANGPEAIIGMFLKKKTGMTIGNYFVILNTIIIGSSILYGDITLIIYSLMGNYVASKTTDFIMLGLKRYYVVEVLSENYLEVTDFIHKKLNRGVIFVHSLDTKSLKKQMLLKSVVSNRELVVLKQFIMELDDDSFVYATPSTSLHGGGFESL